MTDLAVLKVNATNLPTLEFGDSSKARVGDWVIAIGNPFGLGGTVSAGIVSARGRDINIGMYDEFIQTDAAINRGNSGGPMIDTKGRIIGVNTAIFSTTGGGSIGIGFAVPSNVVKNIVAQLITDKKVTRGWVGVQIQDIDQAMAKVLKLPNTQGALISGVTSGGPADKAGLKVGDIIVSANDIKVENKKILPKLVSMHKPEELEKELINEKDGENRSRLDSFSLEEETFEDMGFKASNITDEVKRIFGLGKDVTGGVLITAIENGSLAEEKGLVPGLIIASVNNRKISNIKTLKEVLKDKTQNNFMFLVVEPTRNLQFFISLTRGKTEETEE
ncbi:UNVERIFIED_CONTAM: hypothetical protein PYX00_011125 [Menopon gallinae]|uniref:Probable periplasmic serine endoprotease DegP-like n=1 Tax=Menopon gallinae TaxID=328185 RepID=A0AAW2H685_9NEOP